MSKLASRNYFCILWVCFILYNNRRELLFTTMEESCQHRDPPRQTSQITVVTALDQSSACGRHGVVTESYRNKLNYGWSNTMTQVKAWFWTYFCWKILSRKKKDDEPEFPDKNRLILFKNSSFMFSLCQGRTGTSSPELSPAEGSALNNWQSSLLSPAALMGLIYYRKAVNFWQ